MKRATKMEGTIKTDPDAEKAGSKVTAEGGATAPEQHAAQALQEELLWIGFLSGNVFPAVDNDST